MRPTDFPEANRTLAAPAHMPDCQELRIQADGNQTLSAWQMSWRERLSALVFGRVWLCVLGNVGTQPPVWLTAERDCHVSGPEATHQPGGTP